MNRFFPILLILALIVGAKMLLRVLTHSGYKDQVVIFFGILLGIFLLFILIVLIKFLWKKRFSIGIVLGVVEKKIEMVICKHCHTIGFPSRVRKGGSFGKFVEIFLWVILITPIGWVASILGYFLVPIGFTIWRNANRYSMCKKCGEKNLLPLDSPAGKQLQMNLAKD